MNNRVWFAAITAALLLVLPTGVHAQDEEPVTISAYHVAPGQHMAFLEWMAARDAIAAEVGAPQTDWYVHLNGASWDFVGIAAPTTDAQDDQIEALAKQRGLTVGAAAGMELRTMIASHEDTEAMGPMTSSEIVGMINGE